MLVCSADLSCRDGTMRSSADSEAIEGSEISETTGFAGRTNFSSEIALILELRLKSYSIFKVYSDRFGFQISCSEVAQLVFCMIFYLRVITQFVAVAGPSKITESSL